jgi:hypothetical protein
MLGLVKGREKRLEEGQKLMVLPGVNVIVFDRMN